MRRSARQARLLPELRAGARAAPARARLGRAGRPGRPLVPREARDAGGRDRRRQPRLQRPADRRPGRASDRRRATGPSATTRTTTWPRCSSRTRSRAPPRCSGAICWRRRMPFPQPPGEQYHDHWLALVALASGRIAYVDRPLYDYVQHGGATLGHAAAARMPTGLGQRVRRLLGGSAGEAALGSRAGYFYGFRRLQLLAQVLLMRCGDRMDAKLARRTAPADSRRALARVDALAGGQALARPVRAGRDRWRRAHPAPGDRLAARAAGARRSVAAGRRRASRSRRRTTRACPATSGPRSPAAAPNHPFVRKLAGFIEPLELAISERAPRRVNLLVPTIELKHLFGGYIAKFNLARKLAEQGLRTQDRRRRPDAATCPLDWRRAGRVLRGAGRPVRPGRGRVRARRGRSAGGQSRRIASSRPPGGPPTSPGRR